MGIKNEISEKLKALKAETEERIREIGQSAVEVAVQNGTYHDVTGNLRRSNGFEYSNGTARLYNSAPYAGEVSARGHDVLDSATAYLQEELNKTIKI